MTPDSFWISIKLTLTGFAIYRIVRFLNRHRSLETGGWLTLTAFLTGSLMRGGGTIPDSLKPWAYTLIYGSIFLFIFEPEWIFLSGQIIQAVKKTKLHKESLEELTRAAAALSAVKTGVLMAFERTDDLLKIGESGIEINADIKSELITSIFTKDTQTHDGGAVIRGNKITHCAVIFPLTKRTDLPNDLGTRHRAAIGLSEQTDAVCLVISEESGSISLTADGELIEHVSARDLGKLIRKLLHEKKKKHFLPFHYLRRFSMKREETQFVLLRKSMGLQIYSAVMMTFWLLFSFHLNHANQHAASEIVLNTPWNYAPFILCCIYFLSFICTHSFSFNGLNQRITEEKHILGLRFFSKHYQAEQFHSIQLKKELGGIELWTLALVHRKNMEPPKRGKRKGRRKMTEIEQASAPRILNEWAQKIGAALNLPVMTGL